ncbi:MAG: DNA mismatch repair endonuclease MutL [Lachnospiraceae bacterium]|nr:DNA mismatch repair endonuclease MutL [Lachnospiraceae bacterium]
MPEIKVLDQETINKIAAGEVIDRPASVVKELLENAIDAKSSAVTVEIKDGGISLIRITDNGCGFEKEQIPVAFLRHSTSKIKSIEDLATVSSLGFRGEALSSIAAVAQVELITKPQGVLNGFRYQIEGGKEKSLEEIGAPEGTTFIVRNLFYNTPARRKFLKTPVTEAGYIADVVEKIALSHPEVSIRFINNGQTKLHTTGNGKIKDIIYNVYGREITAALLPVEFSSNNVSMTGFIGKPILSRGNRAYENYFINGRYIKSNLISKAIEEGYHGYMMQHKYPFTVLHIDIESSLLDVNVHPSKMELRFRNAEEIYQNIINAIRYALTHKELIPEVSAPTPKPAQQQTTQHVQTQQSKTVIVDKREDNVQEHLKQELQKKEEIKHVKQEPIKKERAPEVFEVNRIAANIKKTDESLYTGKAVQGQLPVIKETVATDEKHLTVVKEESLYNVGKNTVVGSAPIIVQKVESLSQEQPKTEQIIATEQMSLFTGEKLLSEQGIKKQKIIGQLFDTYWLVEFEDKLFIIDQHAAHEKILYERTLKNLEAKVFTSQQISPPIIITLSMHEEEHLRNYMKYFEEIGFEIEHFGGREYSIRAVPDNLYGLAQKDLFIEMLDSLAADIKHTDNNMVLDKIASMSCKAAVKGNHKLSFLEVENLINELLTLDNPYNCPHGRPTIISMSQYEIEKKFKRII